MATTNANSSSFSARRKWLIGLSVAVAIAALLALVVMANYLSARYYMRIQWSTDRQAQLSPQTLRVLRSITNQVKVTVFFDTREEKELHGLLVSLLKEYNYHNRKIVFTNVDPSRNPGEAELVLSAYKLSGLRDKNFVVVDCDGHFKIFYQTELADYRLEQVEGGQPNEYSKRMIAFKGETVFTTAIFNLVNPREFKICFLQGHGEHDPEKIDPTHGYAKFAGLLKEKNNGQWEKISLFGTNNIPPECHLLIIAGPREPYDEQELTKIENYLKQGGRLFALLNNMALGRRSGIERILGQWGVGVADNVVSDPEHSPTGKDLLVAQMDNEHPITKALAAADSQIRLVLPRAIGRLLPAASTPNMPEVKAIAATGKDATETTDIRDGVPNFNPFRDRRGVFPLIVAVEQGSVKGVSSERGAMRMVVVGDSLCLDNELIDTAGNHYFAALTVDWLLDRPQILLEGLLPTSLKEYKLVMTQRQTRAVHWILLAGMPGSVLLFGVLVWWRRRR